MIVVMPFGHTPDRPGSDLLANTDFGDDLIKDLIPYVDANFRTKADQPDRAMAGLSMGGSHTLRFGLTHPELFDHIGIFSMGLGLGPQGGNDVTAYEAANDAALKRAAQDLDLVYYAMGKDDFLYGTVAPTRAMFARYGIHDVYNESGGGHTWSNWRRYLADFAPRLFRWPARSEPRRVDLALQYCAVELRNCQLRVRTARCRLYQPDDRSGLEACFELQPGGQVPAPQDGARGGAKRVELENDNLAFANLMASGLDHAAVHRQVVDEQCHGLAVHLREDVGHEGRTGEMPAFYEHAAQFGGR